MTHTHTHTYTYIYIYISDLYIYLYTLDKKNLEKACRLARVKVLRDSLYYMRFVVRFLIVIFVYKLEKFHD